MQGASRPLSPHLQIYRWQITMWLSSLHRITGLLLSLGALALAIWLIALASGPAAFADVQAVYGSALFKVPLIAWTFCLFLHLSNGVRHLFWDAGMGFDRSQIRTSGLVVVAVTLVATVAFALFAIV
ncbi:MAG TPA: succinate dehydrogenase, cytochrome b556 subunit [Gammaproteobacteria bacterium]|jgi:succinate dehydrogenase / fumarate reductase cytochrome b subunit|nr:succinate dehydrogenase, cytochrome b556 subunit [Gammaproteobacteria bacterium]